MPYTTNEGTRIYWEEQGAGEPLLLIMGLGYSLEMWGPTRDVVAQRYRTLLFDNRGVGRSDVPAPPYSIPEDGRRCLRRAGCRRRGTRPCLRRIDGWADQHRCLPCSIPNGCSRSS